MRQNFITTDDGSHTLFMPELNEHYHSTNGALQESKHVFIEAGLKIAFESKSITNHDNHSINILEIGFGTGLNAYLTLLESEKYQKNLFYHAIELYPLPKEVYQKLNYPALLQQQYSIEMEKASDLFMQLHSSPWEKSASITTKFNLLKQRFDFSKPSQFNPNRSYDLIYFDAFAPDKQPTMWEEEIFRKIYTLCSRDAIFVTYCAKGAVRRMLQNVGFQMERLPGPPGKREILRGRK